MDKKSLQRWLRRMGEDERIKFLNQFIFEDEDEDEDDDDGFRKWSKEEALEFMRKLGKCKFGTPIIIHDEDDDDGDENMEAMFVCVKDGLIHYLAYSEQKKHMCSGECAPYYVRFKGE